MFLWRDQLDINSPEVQMVIATLIYGVKCAGQMTIAAIQEVADYARENHPETKEGADMVSDDSYVDDLLGTAASHDKADDLMEQSSFVLGLGSMEVKDYTVSGKAPSPEVSADGETVGVLGYL